MNLSEHFTLEELTFSQIALRSGIDNTPGAGDIANLTELCATLLEPCRGILGAPLYIDSGFRSPAVNLRAGGATGSAHLVGLAADIKPIAVPLRNAFEALRFAPLPYDQIIFECAAWIHLAIAPAGCKPRREALMATGRPGAWQYQLIGRTP